ncbi:MAG: hypothetical protein R3B45_09540 [Bdellovibrionota bacterium]
MAKQNALDTSYSQTVRRSVFVLDVQMNEDQSRIRTGNAAENIARIRRLTINMLKPHDPRKKRTSIRKKKECPVYYQMTTL